MKLNEYQALARRTAKPLEGLAILEHAVLGLTSEAGELATALKAHKIYGKPLDHVNVLEELGDHLWFITEGCAFLGISLEDVAKANIAKLRKRFPVQFSESDGLARADKEPGSDVAQPPATPLPMAEF